MSRTPIPARRAALALAAAITAAAVAPAAAVADQQYDFKLNLSADQQWAFDQATNMSMQIQVGGPGGQQVQQAATQKRVGTATVLAVKDGAPTALTVAFGPDSGQTATQNGQPQNQPFPLAGKTVRVKKDDLGIVQIDGAETDPATTAELTNMLSPDRSLSPPHPVSIGDAWPGDSAAMGKSMGLGPNDSVSLKCKLLRIATVAGRSAAELAVNVVGTKTENGVTTKMTLDGTADADLATGQTLQADITGTMDITGQTDTPQGQQPVTGTGKLEMHQKVRPAGDLPPSPALAPADTAAPVAAADAPVNPLAPGDADRYAGTFRNERLTIQLRPATDKRYTGTITMAGRQFPAVADAGGDRLAGTFQSGGNTFKFHAVLHDATLELVSGNSDYVLKKDDPANPLDAGGSAPVNPLGR